MVQTFRPVHILLVEDNPEDVEIFRRALERARVLSQLDVVRDGQEALEFLFPAGDGGARSRSRPDLVLLDLNTPRVNGFEVLQRIRASKELMTLPVIVLTVSAREEDIGKSYRLGANTYIQKPAEFQNFVRLLEVIGEYWFVMAKLPRVA